MERSKQIVRFIWPSLNRSSLIGFDTNIRPMQSQGKWEGTVKWIYLGTNGQWGFHNPHPRLIPYILNVYMYNNEKKLEIWIPIWKFPYSLLWLIPNDFKRPQQKIYRFNRVQYSPHSSRHKSISEICQDHGQIDSDLELYLNVLSGSSLGKFHAKFV